MTLGPIGLHGGGELVPGDEPFLRALLEEEPTGPAGPAQQATEVPCQIGSLKWKVSREQFEQWEAEMLAETGGRHDEMVGEARALGLRRIEPRHRRLDPIIAGAPSALGLALGGIALRQR